MLSIHKDINEYDSWKPTEKCLKWPICKWIFVVIIFRVTPWKVSVFGVFLVRIFPHLNWIGRDSSYLSVFSLNAGKKLSKKFQVRALFTQCVFRIVLLFTIQYCNNVEKLHREKSRILLGIGGSIDQWQSIVFGNIFDQENLEIFFWQYLG